MYAKRTESGVPASFCHATVRVQSAACISYSKLEYRLLLLSPSVLDIFRTRCLLHYTASEVKLRVGCIVEDIVSFSEKLFTRLAIPSGNDALQSRH